MIEVEIKLPILRRSTVEHGLASLGFIPKDLVKEHDMYFTCDTRNFMERDEALRIRQTENMTERKDSCVITFKGPKLDGVSMTRKELETTVGDKKTMTAILEALGYHAMYPVNKLRQYYELDNIHACVDQVEGLGSFLELEILVPTEEEKDNALSRIEEILDHLGYTMAETTRRSYLYMLQKKAGLL